MMNVLLSLLVIAGAEIDKGAYIYENDRLMCHIGQIAIDMDKSEIYEAMEWGTFSNDHDDDEVFEIIERLDYDSYDAQFCKYHYPLK